MQLSGGSLISSELKDLNYKIGCEKKDELSSSGQSKEDIALIMDIESTPLSVNGEMLHEQQNTGQKKDRAVSGINKID